MKPEGQIFRDAIRMKYKTVDEAAEKLNLTRSALYFQFNKALLTDNFKESVAELLHIDLQAMIDMENHTLGEVDATYGPLKVVVPKEKMFEFILKEMAAMKAAIRVLSIELAEMKSKGNADNQSLTKITFEFEAMMKQQAEQILAEWKLELS